MNSTDIKRLIENSTEPLVFNNLLKWKLVDWDLTKWNECLGNTKLQYRLGAKSKTLEPQWEKTCEIVKGTFEDFLQFNDTKKWLYFDYKYLNQWFIDKFDLRNEINWDNFGFPDIKAEDSTIWIGSQGAHTPCHVDTYGCNLIAQLTGRKLWLLFPPETDLKATRVPYEESTIYSSINFYSPPESMIHSLTNAKCKRIILEPGQVLYVPNGWWHYVENFEKSISINTWIPLKEDNKKRVSEAVTLLMVKALTNGLKLEEQDTLINNSQDINELSTLDVLNLIETSLQTCDSSKTIEQQNTQTNTTINLNNNLENVTKIPNLSDDELSSYLKQQSQKFSGILGENTNNSLSETKNVPKNKSNISLLKKYLLVMTDPDVISLIEEKLKSKF